jgi:hypothetical protein
MTIMQNIVNNTNEKSISNSLNKNEMLNDLTNLSVLVSVINKI